MKHSFEASALDVPGFAQSAGELTGVVPLHRFDRLRHEAVADAGTAQDVSWSARGEWRSQAGEPDQAWLHLQAQVTLPLQCQRCLTPVQVRVAVDRAFRFVADEATALAQDGEAEEDVLVQSRSFDLLALVEDELLMALPMLTQHDCCPVPALAQHWASRQDDASAGQRAHPFAALAALVNKGDAGRGD